MRIQIVKPIALTLHIAGTFALTCNFYSTFFARSQLFCIFAPNRWHVVSVEAASETFVGKTLALAIIQSVPKLAGKRTRLEIMGTLTGIVGVFLFSTFRFPASTLNVGR